MLSSGSKRLFFPMFRYSLAVFRYLFLFDLFDWSSFFTALSLSKIFCCLLISFLRASILACLFSCFNFPLSVSKICLFSFVLILLLVLVSLFKLWLFSLIDVLNVSLFKLWFSSNNGFVSCFWMVLLLVFTFDELLLVWIEGE